MNKTITFILGAGIGSLATYFIVNKIIQNRADEEIESVVTTFKERYDKIIDALTEEQKEELGIYSPSKEIKKNVSNIKEKINEEKNPTEETDENAVTDYNKKVKDLGYSVESSISEDQDKESIVDVDLGPDMRAPYVITEDEFGEFGNEEMTLILYDDKVLADEDDEIIDDPESLLGNCLSELEDEDERLYVRNQDKELDIIVLRSEKNYSDIAPEDDE